MDFSLGNYTYLLLLLLLPLLGVVLLRFIKWRNRRKSVFAESSFQESLFPKTGFFSKIFSGLYLLAFLFLIFAMIAYNLMSLFRTFVLQEKTQKKAFNTQI